MTLTTNLSLGELGEAMAPRSAKSFLGRNRPRKKTHEIARYGAGTIRANIYQKFLQQKEGSEPRWSRRRSPGQPGGCPAWPGRGPRQGASWPPWSSSPAPIGLGIFLILQKL